jgi:protein arginine kinase activator
VATVHLTDLAADGGKKELHLCEECAQEKGVAIKAQETTVADILSAILSSSQLSKQRSEFAKVSCPACGISYGDFLSSGRLGCGNDYEVFAKALMPFLEKVQGSAKHTGKVPSRVGEDVVKTNELIKLRQELRQAVQKEQYEKAARVRDRIQVLEKEGYGDK